MCWEAWLLPGWTRPPVSVRYPEALGPEVVQQESHLGSQVTCFMEESSGPVPPRWEGRDERRAAFDQLFKPINVYGVVYLLIKQTIGAGQPHARLYRVSIWAI